MLKKIRVSLSSIDIKNVLNAYMLVTMLELLGILIYKTIEYWLGV